MIMELKCPKCKSVIVRENSETRICQDGGKLYVINKWMNPMVVDTYLTADPHDPREQYFFCEECGYTEKVYEAYTVLGMLCGEEVNRQMKNE